MSRVFQTKIAQKVVIREKTCSRRLVTAKKLRSNCRLSPQQTPYSDLKLACTKLQTLLIMVFWSQVSIAQSHRPDVVFDSPKPEHQLSFEHIGLRDGLSQSTVLAIVQDSRGFVWFGTRHGINRFDGHSFSTFAYDPDDSASISNNWITEIYEDSENHLWVGTQRGLNKLDLGRNPDHDIGSVHFKRYMVKPASTWNDAGSVFALFEDSNKTLWVGMSTGLFRLDRPGDAFHRLNLTDSTGRIIRPGITAIAEYADSQLLLGTIGDGLLAVDRNGNVFRKLSKDRKGLLQKYPAIVQDQLESWLKTSQPLASISCVGEEQSLRTDFHLPSETDIALIAIGEGMAAMFDYGSLKTQGKTLWRMAVPQTRHAGGALKNRLQLAFLRLPAGVYSLEYQSDRGHSYNNWNAAAPDLAPFWGVHCFAISAEQRQRLSFHLDADTTTTLLDINPVTDIAADGSGDLWMSAGLGGLYRLQITTRQFTNFMLYPDRNQTRLTFLNDLSYDGAGNLWIATNSGLCRFDISTTEATFFQHNARYKESISTDNLDVVLHDRAGNVWTGSVLTEINRTSTRQNHFNQHAYDSALGAPDRLIYNFEAIDENNIAVGTGSGLAFFDRKRERFIQLEAVNQQLTTIRTNVLALLKTRTGQLWIGTNGQGLFYWHDINERGNGSLARFTYEPGNPTSIGANAIWCVYEDADADIWVGTNGGGLFSFNPQDSSFSRHTCRTQDFPNWVRCIFQDSRGTFWVGTEAAGLISFRKGARECRRFLHDTSDPASLSHNSVTAIYEDMRGRMWAATYGGGLNCFDPETGKFEHFTTRHGLANNVVYGILPDPQGCLWLSTNGGLTRFNPVTGSCRNYDLQDGLQSNEFNSNAFMKTEDGEFFFGGINGFNHFYPQDIARNPSAPPVVITSFKAQGRPVLNQSAEPDAIQLGHHEDFISFEFVALDYTNPEKCQYAYQLEGFHEGWNYCGKRRFASYTNLAPGSYRFHVIGSNSDGVWNTKGAAISFTVRPPFWLTWWFRISAAIAVISGMYLLHRLRLRREIEQMLVIHEVRKRAAADFHDELGHNLTKISLFSSIIRQSLNGHAQEFGEYVEKIGDTASSLYEGVRDFVWTLDPEKDCIHDVLVRLKDFGDELYHKTGIAFETCGLDAALPDTPLSMESKHHIILIFKEAMHNALKHANCSTVVLSLEPQRSGFRIILQDDGSGFDQACDSRSGNGLRNMSERAQKIAATLLMENLSPGCQVSLLYLPNDKTR